MINARLAYRPPVRKPLFWPLLHRLRHRGAPWHRAATVRVHLRTLSGITGRMPVWDNGVGPIMAGPSWWHDAEDLPCIIDWIIERRGGVRPSDNDN